MTKPYQNVPCHIYRPFVLLLLTVLTSAPGIAAEQAGDFASGGSETCLACHDFGPDSPVHPMLDSAHGRAGDPSSPMGGRGCESCHGPSANHARAPTRVAPGVSFGPRWGASREDRVGQCLSCHADQSASHWGRATHNEAGLACTSCHDIHAQPDAVLHAASQNEICTTCHKAQQRGIHGLGNNNEDQPPCSSCHSPHDAQPAAATALANRSRGCRSCHDLVAMASDPAVSNKANSYHKVMTRKDRTCLDCHQGIAHGPLNHPAEQGDGAAEADAADAKAMSWHGAALPSTLVFRDELQGSRTD